LNPNKFKGGEKGVYLYNILTGKAFLNDSG